MEKIDYNVYILVVKGRVNYSINDKRIVGEKGDLLYIPSETVRSGKNHASGAHQKYTVAFTLAESGEKTATFPIKHHFHHIKAKNPEYVKHRMERLFVDSRGDRKFQSYICNGILQELLGMFARELESPAITPSKVKYAAIIEQYLLKNYRRPIEIEQLAKLINRSSSYTISVFKEVMGQSPIKYIHQLRISEACNLLLNTAMTVAAISDYLGYYDPSYFSRMFKKLTSMSPKEFAVYGHQLDISRHDFK
ncbi:AraC-type DNA-binding protein [Evansella caseinilytica]|uniref:AraC-type DNA-binding protein n=1 Tax=Evansella caseinilytica TaxID=1503961 RepID=A0A1H3UUC3_9BACI|nr:AraC family transcriptional regulator [Evansella caseinilytica]SDZ65928.1 AraC-type DNA-binding protein [Evansella caseinilytica]